MGTTSCHTQTLLLLANPQYHTYKQRHRHKTWRLEPTSAWQRMHYDGPSGPTTDSSQAAESASTAYLRIDSGQSMRLIMRLWKIFFKKYRYLYTDNNTLSKHAWVHTHGKPLPVSLPAQKRKIDEQKDLVNNIIIMYKFYCLEMVGACVSFSIISDDITGGFCHGERICQCMKGGKHL